MEEARRKDPDQFEFLQAYQSLVFSLAPVFDRMPKYAWVAKQFLEPERIIQFRVAWLDDAGHNRMNRGWRIQYSSALGPYEGGTHFNPRLNLGVMKSIALDKVLINSLADVKVGAAAGGADFNPHNKSEAEIQRFCQSYTTELAKYIGPDSDSPGMGYGVGPAEIGYMYGQYKRISTHIAKKGQGLLWGGEPPFHQATGFGAVHFANEVLKDKGETLKGKKCLITGSGKNAMAVAEKLLEYGAIPLTLSDTTGVIYEPRGFDKNAMKTLKKIKSERGARVGRYIIASTTAKYNEPENMFTIPCDVVFPCGSINQISADEATILADNGCIGVFEGSNMPLTSEAISVLKKRGLLFGPYKASLGGATLINGFELAALNESDEKDMDNRVKDAMSKSYELVKATAKEFNTRGDLNAGANIAAFMKVADSMFSQGSV